MAGNNLIQVLRGTNAGIQTAASNGQTLLDGQLLYNSTTNMLTIGGGSGEDSNSLTKTPILASGLHGRSKYTSDFQSTHANARLLPYAIDYPGSETDLIAGYKLVSTADNGSTTYPQLIIGGTELSDGEGEAGSLKLCGGSNGTATYYNDGYISYSLAGGNSGGILSFPINTSGVLAVTTDIADYAEPKFSKNTAFNKNFGTTSGTVCQGNDSRLSDTRNTKNSITFNSGGSGASSGTTFNGSAARTISYNTIGAVPTGRTVNGHALSSNVTVTKSDVGLANVANERQYSASNPPPIYLHMLQIAGNSGTDNFSLYCNITTTTNSPITDLLDLYEVIDYARLGGSGSIKVGSTRNTVLFIEMAASGDYVDVSYYSGNTNGYKEFSDSQCGIEDTVITL